MTLGRTLGLQNPGCRAGCLAYRNMDLHENQPKRVQLACFISGETEKQFSKYHCYLGVETRLDPRGLSLEPRRRSPHRQKRERCGDTLGRPRGAERHSWHSFWEALVGGLHPPTRSRRPWVQGGGGDSGKSVEPRPPTLDWLPARRARCRHRMESPEKA